MASAICLLCTVAHLTPDRPAALALAATDLNSARVMASAASRTSESQNTDLAALERHTPSPARIVTGALPWAARARAKSMALADIFEPSAAHRMLLIIVASS